MIPVSKTLWEISPNILLSQLIVLFIYLKYHPTGIKKCEKPELLQACFTMLAKKKIYAEDIAKALDMNVSFLENLVGMEIPRKPRTSKLVEESA